MDDMNDMLDTKDLFSEKERSGLSPSGLENSLAGRLEDSHIRNSLETSTPRGSNAHTYNLRKKKREMNVITSIPEDHPQKQEISPPDDVNYPPKVDATKSHLGGSSLHETPGHMFVTPNLCEALESCLSALLHSPKGFCISLALNDGEIITPVTLDVYRPRSHSSLEPYSVTKNSLSNDKLKPGTQPNASIITMTPLCQDVLTMNRQVLTTELALDPDTEFMGKSHMCDIERRESHYNLPSRASLLGKAPRTIVGDKPKQAEGSSDSFTTRYGGHRAKFGTKRKKLEDYAELCSVSSSDTSDESDESESEDDNVPVWVSSHNNAQYGTIPTAFQPYIRGFETDISSLPCGDSPESGSGTGGSANQNTPASSGSSLPGTHSLHGTGNPPLGAGPGSSSEENASVLRYKSARGEDVIPRQPRPLVCWYPAAGIACTSRKIKKDPKTRRLWIDHVCAPRVGPSHQLPEKCMFCSLQFVTQTLLEEHVQNSKLKGMCKQYSAQELVKINSESNRHGVSRERIEVVKKMREQIEKALKKGGPPAVFDVNTMELLTKRVDSNVTTYINGSDTPEKTAESELWKWYLIFKQLHPDEEVPLNPFTTKKKSVGPMDKFTNDALYIFNYNVDQRIKERGFNRNDLSLAFLDSLEMANISEHQEEGRRSGRKRARLSPAEELAPGPELAGPEPAGTRLAIWQQLPAPPPATVAGGALVPGQRPNTLYDPPLPVMGEQLGFSPGENQYGAYQLEGQDGFDSLDEWLRRLQNGESS